MDYTLISVCIFSILFFIYFLRCQEGEFVKKIKLVLVGDDFLNDLLGDSGVILYEEIRCYSLVRVKVLKTVFN